MAVSAHSPESSRLFFRASAFNEANAETGRMILARLAEGIGLSRGDGAEINFRSGAEQYMRIAV